MKSLLERMGGSVTLAQKWIGWVRDKRNLQTAIEELRRFSALKDVQIDRLKADVEARDALIKQYRIAQRELPREIKSLMDEADSLLRSMIADAGGIDGARLRSWISEYRAWRFDSQRHF